jgi:hypothetical protein
MATFLATSPARTERRAGVSDPERQRWRFPAGRAEPPSLRCGRALFWVVDNGSSHAGKRMPAESMRQHLAEPDARSS